MGAALLTGSFVTPAQRDGDATKGDIQLGLQPSEAFTTQHISRVGHAAF